MARYIDADKFIEWLDVGHLRSPSEICYSEGDVKVMIDMQPTADVAPKSEVDNLEYTLMGVMHSVDKWLEGDELKQNEVNRAITMREKTLRIIENAKTEVARDIFEEIYEDCFDQYGYINYEALAELKKKYTGEQT